MIPYFSCSCNAKCPAMRAFPHSRAASFFIIRVCSGPLIFQRCLHLSTDLEQIGPGLLGAPQDGLHLFPLLRGQGLVLGQQVGVALNDGQRRFELMGKLDDLLPAAAAPFSIGPAGWLSAPAPWSAGQPVSRRIPAPAPRKNRSLPRPFSPATCRETSVRRAVSGPGNFLERWVLHTTAPTSSRMPRMQCTVCTSGSFPRSAGAA